MNKKDTTLSFCITCKNRFHQIKKTLPQNIKDNYSMKSVVDFVLVDFGSTDGLQDWIFKHFEQEVNDGYLKYYYTEELTTWHTSVAKNTAHILSQGDILVNLDCDNYTGIDGGKFILKQMDQYGINSTVIHQFSNIFGDGSHGRIALSKQNFWAIGGYNENFEPMGYEDTDLLLRLRIFGLNCINIAIRKYNKAIANDKAYSNEMNRRNYLISYKNITSGKLKANTNKNHIGITQNIYEFK